MKHKKNTEEKPFEFEDVKRGVRIFLLYAKKYKRKLTASAVLAVVSAALLLIFPKISGDIIDGVIASEGSGVSVFSLRNITLALGLYILVRTLGAFVEYAYMYRVKTLGARLEFDYMTDMFAHVLRLPFSFLRNQKTGSMIAKIEQASDSLDVGMGMLITRMMPSFLTILGVIILSGFIDIKLVLVLIFVIVLHVVVIQMRSGILAKTQKKQQIIKNKAKGETYDALYNTEIVKYSNAIDYEIGRITENNNKRYVAAAESHHHGTINRSIRVMLRTVSYALVLLVCSQLVLSGEMTPGQFVTFLLYLNMMLEPMRIIFWMWDQIQDSLLALRFSEEIASMEQEVSSKGKDVSMGDIVFEGVSFSYTESKNEHALSDISCTVKQGETIALVGRSGSGKSTFVNLLMGYFAPTKGKIMIGGTETAKANTTSLRSLIAVVPQDISLFNQTIQENISYGTNASKEEVHDAAKKSYCLEFIEKFPKTWDQKVGEKGLKLSGGQKQRVALARAILQDPEILILDEPTSALDAVSEYHIEKALQEVMIGKTTIIIAHRLRSVLRADRIFVMERGKIIEKGNHKELMLLNGEYAKLYNLQVEIS